MEIEQLTVNRSESIPNSRLPALIYRGVFDESLDREMLARAFESMFDGHDWPPAWRNGVFDHDHFHCDAHEVLGVYDGRAELVLGGEGGSRCVVAKNDAVVIPAGVSHRKVSTEGRFACVGAYPSGQDMGIDTPSAARCQSYLMRVDQVAMPSADPVLGSAGALVELWRAV
jgi:uncharacterized protein YjlB